MDLDATRQRQQQPGRERGDGTLNDAEGFQNTRISDWFMKCSCGQTMLRPPTYLPTYLPSDLRPHSKVRLIAPLEGEALSANNGTVIIFGSVRPVVGPHPVCVRLSFSSVCNCDRSWIFYAFGRRVPRCAVKRIKQCRMRPPYRMWYEIEYERSWCLGLSSVEKFDVGRLLFSNRLRGHNYRPLEEFGIDVIDCQMDMLNWIFF